MSTYSIKIDENALKQKVNKAVEENGSKIAYQRAYGLYYRARNKFLEKFENHPITVELEGAAQDPLNFPNLSNTLGGYGNLYSFLGFDKGTDPIAPLRTMLEEGIYFKKTVFRNNTWYFRIGTPSKEQIESVTEMPWERGNSWADAVEKDNGISNLSYFINKKNENSRSGGGIQAGWEINEDLVFKKREYLSELFDEFRKSVNQ